jgi:citrate synthase
MAARVAASARASGYAVVTAALGAFDSPLHGNTGQAAAELLRMVVAGTPPERAIAAQLRSRGRGVPGFGHALYLGTDPRARTLLPLIAALPGAEPVTAAVEALSLVVEPSGLHPNLDLALAALAVATGMAPDAPGLVFATGRLAGWISHAATEYGAEPMRLRPRGRYVGPLP